MYNSTIQTLATIFIFFATIVVGHSQTPIYSFTFDEGLDDWTAVGISSSDPERGDSALWVWAPEGNAGTGAFNSGNIAIGSPSAGGALLFDSDGYDNGGDDSPDAANTGPVPAPQKGEIISPPLDFSMETRVILAFYQQYRYFAHDAENDFETTNSYFEVSGDGGMTWTSFPVNEDISPNNSTRATDVIVQDISDIAAGQADVRVKFVWDGEYYFWLIDDVNFYNERGNDLAITAFTNVNNFETPDFSMVDDTVDLEMMVANHGDTDVTDTIMLWTRVLDNDLGVVFSDTGYIVGGLAVQDTTWYDFEDWIPSELEQNGTDENYNVVYNVRIKGDTAAEIVKPDDNVDFQGFLVRDLTLRKVAGGDGIGFTGEAGPGAFEDFTWANLFNFPNSFSQNLKISKVTFDAFSIDRDNDPLNGKSVVIYIFKLPAGTVMQGDTMLLVEIDGTLDLINFDINGTVDELAADPEIAIGVGSYQFSARDDSEGGPFSADVTDFEGDGPVIIEAGFQYLIAVDYIGAANTIAQEVSESFPLYQVSSMAHYPSLGSGNSFLLLRTSDRNYARNVASIGVELEFTDAVDENPLPENSVKIFPNPANEVMNIDIDFETPAQTTVFLADAAGRILMVDTKKNLMREQLNYDLTKFASGTYVVRVSTHEGTKTEHIIIAH